MKKIFLAALLILIIFSCNKDYDANLKCKDDMTVKIPSIIPDYFIFKPGTWWVYENTTTRAYDSLWVAECKKEITTEPAQKKECNCAFGYCFEKATIRINNLEYQLDSELPNKRSSYVDIVISKKFMIDFPSLDQSTYDVSIECMDDKFPVTLFTVENNKFNQEIIPPDQNNSGRIYINDTFNINDKKYSAYIGETIIDNKIVYSLNFTKKIGLYHFFTKKSGNLVLKRWNIVQ